MRWPLQPLQPFQQTPIQPPFGQSVDLLGHPWFTTTNLSYRFPILKLPPPPCAVLLVYIYIYYIYIYTHISPYLPINLPCTDVLRSGSGWRWTSRHGVNAGPEPRGVRCQNMSISMDFGGIWVSMDFGWVLIYVFLDEFMDCLWTIHGVPFDWSMVCGSSMFMHFILCRRVHQIDFGTAMWKHIEQVTDFASLVWYQTRLELMIECINLGISLTWNWAPHKQKVAW